MKNSCFPLSRTLIALSLNKSEEKKWMEIFLSIIFNSLAEIENFHSVCECAVKHRIELKGEKRERERFGWEIWRYALCDSIWYCRFFWGFAISKIKFMTFNAPSNYSVIFDTFLFSVPQLKMAKIHFSLFVHSFLVFPFHKINSF